MTTPLDSGHPTEFGTEDGLTLRYWSWSRDPDPALPPWCCCTGSPRTPG